MVRMQGNSGLHQAGLLGAPWLRPPEWFSRSVPRGGICPAWWGCWLTPSCLSARCRGRGLREEPAHSGLLCAHRAALP